MPRSVPAVAGKREGMRPPGAVDVAAEGGFQGDAHRAGKAPTPGHAVHEDADCGESDSVSPEKKIGCRTGGALTVSYGTSVVSTGCEKKRSEFFSMWEIPHELAGSTHGRSPSLTVPANATDLHLTLHPKVRGSSIDAAFAVRLVSTVLTGDRVRRSLTA